MCSEPGHEASRSVSILYRVHYGHRQLSQSSLRTSSGWRFRLTLVVAATMLVSLFLTFYVLYDNAVISMQYNQNPVLNPPSYMSQAVNTTDIAENATREQTNTYKFPKTCRRLPQALIVGVRKAGTRALLEMLYLHPRVQKAAGEVHFFDRDENYNLGLEWYRKKMPFSFHGQITIEKSPSYFVMPEVPERVHAMNSTIKIMIIVRDPVTRAISDYTQLRSHAATAGTAQSSAVISAANTTKSFEEMVLLLNGTVNEVYRPLVVSLYQLHIQRWLEVFPREQILIVNGDRLIADPVPQLKRIESFLGLENRIDTHNFYFNETKGFYCLRTNSTDKCLRETKGRKHPHVDPLVMTRLRRYFAEHNQRFYDMIGEDLSWPET